MIPSPGQCELLRLGSQPLHGLLQLELTEERKAPLNKQVPSIQDCGKAPVPVPDIDFDSALQELGNHQQDQR